MRDQRYGFRVIWFGHLIVTAVYIAIGTVVYWYCGIYVASPALGSAGALMKRISYGLALPGLFVTICIYLHVRSANNIVKDYADRQLPSKYIFLRLMKGSPHLTSNSFTHWAVWLSCTATCAIIAYIIAR
jgi:hypothetical protein